MRKGYLNLGTVPQVHPPALAPLAGISAGDVPGHQEAPQLPLRSCPLWFSLLYFRHLTVLTWVQVLSRCFILLVQCLLLGGPKLDRQWDRPGTRFSLSLVGAALRDGPKGLREHWGPLDLLFSVRGHLSRGPFCLGLIPILIADE